MSHQETKREIVRVHDGQAEPCSDWLAVEEPLELRIVFGPLGQRKTRSLAVTMRTPGNDLELAAGFLVSEGIISTTESIVGHRFVGPLPMGETQSNTIEIELAPTLQFEFSKLQRNFYTTSSCGVCGKASLEAIQVDGVSRIRSQQKIQSQVVHRLPALLRQQQNVFDRTGGLHAAGLATITGDVNAIREDVGRHNAVDKLIGSQLLAGAFPLGDSVLVLSGRASFELMQKALLASIPFVVAVGAPSSLAVELAREFDLTLIGFTSQTKFNIYSGQQRIDTSWRRP